MKTILVRIAWGQLLFFVASLPLCTHAGNIEGAQILAGTVEKIVEINRFKITSDVSPDAAGLPRRFVIDLGKKVVRPSRDSLIRRTIEIRHIEHVENSLILQGVDEGVEGVDDAMAWSLVIAPKTGKVVLAASGDSVAYVVFGTCSAAGGPP